MAMFAMSSAWILYDRARSVTGAAQQIGSWMSLLLADSDTHVRQLLEALGKRVDAVAPTLNFCMLWAQEKGTCISDVVFQSRDTLFRVEKFIHSCTQAANHAKTHDKEYMLRELKAHLRELEFSISSMTLAISLINASRPYQPTTTYLDSTLSPSALLRASERLRSMSDAGGDVTSSFGSFYKANVTSNDTGACVWKRIWSSAAIKIYRNAARQLYELHVEDAKTIPVTSTTTTPSAHLTFDLDGSIDFRSSSSQALGIQFIKDVTQEKLMTVVDVSFTWVEQIANQIQSRYAFCLHDIGHQSTGLVDSLRPLDIAYIARLCVYENMCQAHQRVEKKAKPVLAHTVATDEELWLLFSACSSSCLTSSTATSSTSSTSTSTSSTSTSSTSATSVASISTSTSTPVIPSHSQSQSQSSQSQSHPQPPFANIIRSFSVPSTPAFPSTSSQPPFPSTSTTISTSTTDPTASFVYSDDGEPLPIRYRPSIDSDIDDEHHHIKDEAFTSSIHAAMSSTLAESIHETSQHIQSSFQSKYASQHQLSSQPSSQHQPSSDWPDLDIDVGVTDVSYTDQSEQESLL